MVSVELQGLSDVDQMLTTSGSITLTGAAFDLKVGDREYTGLSVSGTATALENLVDPFDINSLIGLFNTEFQTASVDGVLLSDLVEARINDVDPSIPLFVIALKPEAIADGLQLELHNPSSEMNTILGFPADDGDAETAELLTDC